MGSETGCIDESVLAAVVVDTLLTRYRVAGSCHIRGTEGRNATAENNKPSLVHSILTSQPGSINFTPAQTRIM